MRIIRQRQPEYRSFRANDYDRQRLEEVAQDRCGICWDLWPASMLALEDGYTRCPDCLAIRTEAVKRDIQAHDAMMQSLKQTRPQMNYGAPFREVVPHIRRMQDVSASRILPQSAPLVLVRGGSAVSLVIKGGGFASGNTFTYTSGISDNSAPSLSGSTQWTLSLVASGGMAAGFAHMTFEGHTYRNIFMVA
jgi:hypothetical protein